MSAWYAHDYQPDLSFGYVDNHCDIKPDFSYPLECKPSSSIGRSSVFSSTTDDSSHVKSGRSTAECDIKPDITEISTEKAPRECVVCFQPTSCYHYDVPACTGCKTFFRRCLVTNREYKCQYGGHCDITQGQDCKGCRFERCIISGMNAAAIQYPKTIDGKKIVEKVKVLKRRIIEDNKPVVSKMLPAFSQTKERQEIDFLLYLEAKQRRLRESTYNPQQLFRTSLRDLLQKSSELSLADKYEKPSEWPMNQQAITERLKKGKEEIKRTGKYFVACDLILTIEVAKILPAFNFLTLDDQEALMRHVVVVNMVLTQSFYSYLQHLDVIIYPNGVVPVKMDEIFGRAPMQVKIETHTRSVQTLSRTSITPEQFVLLKAIIYCHPACDNLSTEGREIITKYHEKYSGILLRHLQDEYGNQAGASKYGSLICLIEAYFHFAEKSKQIHLMHKINRKCMNQSCMTLVEECMQ
uniref:Uncharacterized protein n=2 Tax=Panagrolaimus sp. ES5 TaxID=591445 RepID=A0AC34F5B2_9BILA